MLKWLAVALFAAAAPAVAATPPSVIPAPLAVTPGAGAFRLSREAMLIVPAGDPGARRAAQQLNSLLSATAGLDLAVRTGPARPGSVSLVRAAPGSIEPEGYALKVSNDGVRITAADDAGLLYGAITFWQLVTAEPAAAAAGVEIAAVEISDRPRFRWRGLMLDSARHYQSPEYIKQFIDWMAVHKLNVLHWHLTDDQGWRLEIKKYPKLTSVGAWRTPAYTSPTPKPERYGGFYTQAQVRDLVAYAADRNITIVPEIDLPGHASAAIAAYPWLASAPPASAAVPADWGVYPNLFSPDERTIGFLQDVLTEVMALFPGKYIHLGGDEAVKDQWRASPLAQRRMRELGLKSEAELQGWFMRRLSDHLSAQGRRLVGWDEILEGGAAPGATVMSWRGVEGAVTAARLGHDTVLTPAPDLYLDNRQSSADGAPGRARIVSLESVYRFEPVPPELTAEQRRRVLGVQANLWTEHMRTEDRVTYMAYPRAAALAEAAWSEHRDWESFKQRLRPQLGRYRSLGVKYAERGLDGVLAPQPAPAPDRRSDHELELCSEGIALSLVDDAPARGERAAFMMDIMNPCWIWRDADLTGVTALEIDVGQVPFNFQIGDDLKKVTVNKARTAEGELEVRLGGCEAPVIATAVLAQAARRSGVTTLRASTPAGLGTKQTLCFTFNRPNVDPLWGVDQVRLVRGRR